MASPLQDVWQKLISVVHPNLAGPDVVTNSSLPTAGKYVPEGAIHSVVSSMIPGLVHPGGTIQVNPNNTANLNTTIQHEKVHALLSKYDNDGTMDKLNAANPYYPQMISKIQLEPGGDSSMEAPAYAATGEYSQFGIDPKVAQASLESFAGTWRRFEYKGETKNGARVYDDYGHHPTEIRATLQGARELYPRERLIVAFQPHLYSRTKLLLDDFAAAFEQH